ncbi:GNAT family N-acetyltransferase [Tenuibacillus multivorans]|uniref:Protein N-acetyltransferase, RimJ/RimL family n=1 Tax=Tenuibacillus multivorans TaxID=237069 RepID=A0A1H0CMC4_9BACI|nr:GNAT family protein [Tenuibacillus multivorans]GEL76239.1 acetyltransferase [Tenuibacillus multivorans]SDN59036.1 Protein N-acetyltransferase, RimJ/RimL family [Tenuibacillus multivorans]
MFIGDQVKLRKMNEDDVELYHRWRNDMDVMTSTNGFLDVHSLSDTKEFVENVLLGSQSSKCYIIADRKTEKPIGITSLVHIDYKNRNAECIIDMGEKNYWGQGYGSDAMKLILHYAFYEMNLHRLYLKVFSFNKKAIHLYNKLGFQIEGTSREELYRNGDWHDVIHMGILQNEYRNK